MWHGTLVWLCMKYVILFFNYHTLLIVQKYFYSAFSTIRDFYFFPNRWPLSVQYGVVPPRPHPTDQRLMFRRPPSRQGLSSSLWPQPPPPSPGSAHRGQGPRRRLMELPAGAGVYMSACMCWCSTWARERERKCRKAWECNSEKIKQKLPIFGYIVLRFINNDTYLK